MTELVFILDRSGSMAGLEADTIGGFNSMIAKQKKEAGEALVSTVLFDNESVVIHDSLPLEKVLKNIIRTRFLYPRVRPYKTENFYALLSARKEAQPIAKQQKGRKARRQKA